MTPTYTTADGVTVTEGSTVYEADYCVRVKSRVITSGRQIGYIPHRYGYASADRAFSTPEAAWLFILNRETTALARAEKEVRNRGKSVKKVEKIIAALCPIPTAESEVGP